MQSTYGCSKPRVYEVWPYCDTCTGRATQPVGLEQKGKYKKRITVSIYYLYLSCSDEVENEFNLS